MSRTLKLSGFIGLTLQMVWGMANIVNLMLDAPIPSHIMRGAHAHFGVLSIAIVVAGFAVAQYELSGTRRSVTVWSLIAGQWLLPLTLFAEMISRTLSLIAFLWGILLFIGMGSIALAIYQES